ncbi:MAG: hydroxyacylglutathione hydrolase [Deltaproteobacteria bacterium]|nr:MAG: hydroxyacylglutathione hydrolase [Deltaproteobacteria bacterium]
MSVLEIVRIPVLRDNYVWLLHCPATGATAAVDPAVAEPVDRALAARGWALSAVLNTHHHADHVGGNLALKRRHDAIVVGPAADADRIPGIDVKVGEGDTWSLGDATAHVLFVPGHTRGHIAFHFPESAALFCGDTLFLMGCGRLFEGTPAQMWDSLRRLRALPGDSRVFCAHEYTRSNARFAIQVDPHNDALRRRAEEVERARRHGHPTVPGRLDEERATNPFLRADQPALAHAVGLDGADPVEVFAELRRRKDNF